MNISYSGPLSRGWDRMKKALFQPFDIAKWINVGFTAFLAGLTDCNGGSSGNHSNMGKHHNWDDFFSFPQTAWNWLTDHPLWFNLIILGIVVLFVISVVLTWLSSRGKFMFLHNVIHDLDEVKKPWHEFKKQGNSLFWWRFIFGWLAFFAFIAYFVFCFITIKNMYYGNIPVALKVWMFAGLLVLLFLILIIIVGYILLFLNDFVVPIMYKHKIGASHAWLKFLPLMGRHLGTFIVYGLFIFALGIAVAVGVIFLALVTCCIGLLLLAIPFVGSVILLPVSYTFRALSIEFLKQFGDDFDVFTQQQILANENTNN